MVMRSAVQQEALVPGQRDVPPRTFSGPRVAAHGADAPVMQGQCRRACDRSAARQQRCNHLTNTLWPLVCGRLLENKTYVCRSPETYYLVGEQTLLVLC